MSIGGQPPVPAPKVPVWRTAIDSYRFVFANLGRLLALGWPLLMIAAAALIVGELFAGGRSSWEAETWQQSPAYVVANILFGVLFCAMVLVFVVRWHRFFLLDERESVFANLFASRNWRFLGYLLLLALAPLLPMLIALIIGLGAAISVAGSPQEGMVTGPLAALVFFALFAPFVLYFVFFRFSLVFPAAATDRPIGLAESWRKLRGNTRRLLRALYLVPLPIMIFVFIVMVPFLWSSFASMQAGGPRPSMTVFFVWMQVLVVIVIFATAVSATVLSKFYRHIVGGETGADGATANSA